MMMQVLGMTAELWPSLRVLTYKCYVVFLPIRGVEQVQDSTRLVLWRSAKKNRVRQQRYRVDIQAINRDVREAIRGNK